jgi:CheY-like chemotaxis protein/HPt (histidine-containing phosphotransfer) domain-containing protein
VPAQARAHRILVAEDNLTNQIVVRGLLEQAGYLDVTVVDDGRQAVEAVNRGGFAAVLMDCRMPVMDGYEATTALRRAGSTVPIIALTANASEQERERCLALGMDDYLTKPLDERRLRETLERWAGQVSTAQPALAPQGGEGGGQQPLPANAVPAAAAALPVLDRAAALERMGGDEDLFGIALDSFRGQLPRIAPQVRAALAQQQAVEAHRLLHSLAGSSSMVGAEALHACARELEALALAKDLAGVERGLPRLEQQVQAFMEA